MHCSSASLLKLTILAADCKHECHVHFNSATICYDQLSREKEFAEVEDYIDINRIQIGSAPVVVSDAKRFVEKYGIKLYQGYGQTETALRVTGVP